MSAIALDTSSWFVYNGTTESHSFSINYPTDWKSKVYRDELQGFAPSSIGEDSLFTVQENEGKTYDQAISGYVTENTELVSTEDIFLSNSQDLIGKKAVYRNISLDKTSSRTFIKRGGLIIDLSNANMEGMTDYPVEDKYSEEVQAIHDSFSFTDEWHQYINFNDNYSFIFPSSLEFLNTNTGVSITNPSQFDTTIFSVTKYANTPITDAPKEAEGSNENLQGTQQIAFHGIENAVRATYMDKDQDMQFSRIFIENNGDSFGITDVNIENNFPHENYYDSYIVEMLESFEFFSLEGEFASYMYFSDVRDNHSNAEAINTLKEEEVIDGYPDGTFKPDGEINRAELAKLVVEKVANPSPDDYNNCFPDIADEWFAAYVCYAKEMGWVQGYDDETFKPGNNVTRVEALKMILEVLLAEELENRYALEDQTVLDVDINEWYGIYFILADNLDLLDKQHIAEVDGGYNYHPGENMTRKEVAETIFRAQML